MTSNHGMPPEPLLPTAQGVGTLKVPKQRTGGVANTMSSSVSSLPYRGSASAVFASTSSIRSLSPAPNSSSVRDLAGSIFMGTPVEDFPQPSPSDRIGEPRELILQAFVPHIAVYTSTDTRELASDKGFPHGLWQILRPFGEHVQGKVTIRDSVGLSRVCEDFAVRFVELGDGLVESNISSGFSNDGPNPKKNTAPSLLVSESSDGANNSRTGGDIEMVERVVDSHLNYAETLFYDRIERHQAVQNPEEDTASPFYLLYLRKLLSGLPLAPHETFAHPVACIIAISSRNPNPIDALRQLYEKSTTGSKRLPVWVNGDYLRYYVLVHDEERDDIAKSIALFDTMKKHFGLHCHLLRLRSTQCIPSDDDSFQLPPSDWKPASEEYTAIQESEALEEIDDNALCIFETDATAIKTFIREMVTQSIVPSMERSVSTWNDQVASRRRGIGGRILNATKKWNYFGGGSRPSSATGSTGTTTGSNSNYDYVQGFYRPEAPEAIMRKLADYAFMLRDWKLAYSIYDLLRTDFNGDKAWKYHAATNEMAAISSLLTPQVMTSKFRTETIDQMLETASYSYVTRCTDPYGALRCLSLGMELLKLRPGSAADDAARWGSKLLEGHLVGPIGDALLKERIAACYGSRKGAGSGAWGSRNRKAALWNVLAAKEWFDLGSYVQANKRFNNAQTLYGRLEHRGNLSLFSTANAFLTVLERELQSASTHLYAPKDDENSLGASSASIDEESEALDQRSNRKSFIGAAASPLSSLETASLHIEQETQEKDRESENDFR